MPTMLSWPRLHLRRSMASTTMLSRLVPTQSLIFDQNPRANEFQAQPKRTDASGYRFDSAAGARLHMNGWTRAGGWWLAGQLLLLTAVWFAGQRYTISEGAAWISWFGGGLMAASFFIAVRGVFDLGRGLSPMPLPSPRGSLVTTGIYRTMRHPLYADLVLLAVGYSIYRQSLPALLLVVPLAWLLKGKAICEERLMLARYPDYADYIKRTGRFFPKRQRRS